jgi:hypothetical protein
MYKKLSLLLFLSFYSLSLFAQSAIIETITQTAEKPEIEMHLHFLASDEMMGRDTGSPHIKIASRYIAEYLRMHGVTPVPGYDSYFQEVPFIMSTVPDAGEMTLGDNRYQFREDFLVIESVPGKFTAPVIFAEHGLDSDIAELDLNGKIVVTLLGSPDDDSRFGWYQNAVQKNSRLKEAGAVAVIELHDNPVNPWPLLGNMMNRSRMVVNQSGRSGPGIPHILLNNLDGSKTNLIRGSTDIVSTITIEGTPARLFNDRNVIGYIEGTDPELKNEHILLSAHYDHVGVIPGVTEGNYIFNGARDNGVGTAAIMMAGKFLAQNPPKRSVIIAAWTAEERGLIGSRWYAENPMIPLNQTVYNLNIDGAGYNDTTMVTVIGLGRTEADDDLIASAAAFGLNAVPDPVPEQNLFNRSDNVNFARAGIPAPTYSLGFTAFDDEINKYYHQVTDTPESLNFNYITRYIRSYLLAAWKVGNADKAPFWNPGDVYEQAGIDLYGIEE